jgi:hypothetical protein
LQQFDCAKGTRQHARKISKAVARMEGAKCGDRVARPAMLRLIGSVALGRAGTLNAGRLSDHCCTKTLTESDGPGSNCRIVQLPRWQIMPINHRVARTDV